MAKSQREIELQIKSLELQKEANKADAEVLKRLDKKIIAQEKLLSRRKELDDLERQSLNFEKQLLEDLDDARIKNLQTAGLTADASRGALGAIQEIINAQVDSDKKRKALGTIGRIKLEDAAIRSKIINEEEGIKSVGELQKSIGTQSLDDLKEYLKTLDGLGDVNLDDIVEDISKFSEQTKKSAELSQLLTGGLDEIKNLVGLPLGLAAAGALVVTQFVEFGKSVIDTRKELGLTLATSTKLAFQQKQLALQSKLLGVSEEEIATIQKDILANLGGQAKVTNELVRSFAQIQGTLGVTSDTATKLIPVLDAVGAAGERGAIAQIKSLGALAELEGLSPGQILGDVASQTEFFAQFAKDGGTNLVRAAISAKKLGLELSAVASITESLLEFETSIEKQLEASLLLGRQINLDRARQLALTGDQEGLLEEVRRQVGDEAEFNRLNVIQRKALADAFGLQVEQVARAVRGNTAAVTGAAASAGGETQTVSNPTGDRLLRQIRDNLG